MKKTAITLCGLFFCAVTFASTSLPANVDFNQVETVEQETGLSNTFTCTTYSTWTCPDGETYEFEVEAEDCEEAGEMVVKAYESVCE